MTRSASGCFGSGAEQAMGYSLHELILVEGERRVIGTRQIVGQAGRQGGESLHVGNPDALPEFLLLVTARHDPVDDLPFVGD